MARAAKLVLAMPAVIAAVLLMIVAPVSSASASPRASARTITYAYDGSPQLSQRMHGTFTTTSSGRACTSKSASAPGPWTSAAVASSFAAEVGSSAATTAVRAPVYDQMPLFVETPQGLATQADEAASLAARDQVLQGAQL